MIFTVTYLQKADRSSLNLDFVEILPRERMNAFYNFHKMVIVTLYSTMLMDHLKYFKYMYNTDEHIIVIVVPLWMS